MVVNKYNNTYHSTFKVEPVDVKWNTYINPSNETNDEHAKLKIGDIGRRSKCKNIFQKGYFPNCPEEVFLIKKVKNTVPWTYVISDLKGEKLLKRFTKKNWN